MKDILLEAINKVISEMGLEAPSVLIDYPGDMSHGDLYTNVAMMLAKKAGKNPLDLAGEIAENLKKLSIKDVTKIEAVKPGFINFSIDESYFDTAIKTVLHEKIHYGKNQSMKGKKVVVEYTDPNPLKLFHVGHLMSNTIGESVARLIEWTGSDVRRFCFQGDVGRHIALTIYGLRLMETKFPDENSSSKEKVAFFGQAYAKGSTYFKDHPEIEAEVQEINKKVYERSDNEVNEVYDKGREWSLEYFEEIYKILGTKFDRYFFESQSAGPGIKAVEEGLSKGIFEKSDGAIIFNGEKYGLHTDVLITKVGLPTYAGKELGLAEMKYNAFPYDTGITVTANEQNDFFKLTIKANNLLFPFLEGKLHHLSHGMMRLPEGKMGSRTGNVIAGRDFIDETVASVLEKMSERKMSEEDKKVVSEEVAVAAIKFSVLKQTLGKDIIYDKNKALSFEGDSGPYVQYSFVRAGSVLRKGEENGFAVDENFVSKVERDIVISESGNSESALKRLIERFPTVVERAQSEYAPHYVAQYLLALSGAFNSFYANSQIANSLSRLALTKAFQFTVHNGLWLLGIKAPKEM
ncbi:MAG: arginine--tRNA ligase [bacterium]